MYTLGGGSRPPTFQFPATDIPSSSTPPTFQAQPSAFNTGAQDQLAWDEFGYGAILATMDGAPAAGRRACRVTVDTATTCFDSAVTSHNRRSDTGRQSDTGYCRLVAGGHDDTVSRPARTEGRQGT
jgi:hypothetical protein